MKSVMAKYNHAFGYVKSYLVLAGIAGVAFLLIGLLQLAFGDLEGKDAVPMIVGGAVVALLGTLVLIQTRSKCPENKRGIVGLVLTMAVVAVVGCFTLAFRVFGKLLGIGGSSTGGTVFANRYIRESDGANCTLFSVLDDTHATLKDDHGECISVSPGMSDSGLVYDDSNNSYRPC